MFTFSLSIQTLLIVLFCITPKPDSEIKIRGHTVDLEGKENTSKGLEVGNREGKMVTALSTWNHSEYPELTPTGK